MYIEIDFFEKANKLILVWFLSVWNLAQIGFSLLIAALIKKGSTATLVGYTTSVFLILYLNMTSQFLFPNPAYLPWFFYILPHSSFVRFFYIWISKCIDDKCVTELGDLYGNELTLTFVTIHLTAFLYFFVGLMMNEPKWRKIIYRKLRIGSLRRF